MLDLIAIGSLIVEFVRPEKDQPLDSIAPFIGPYPSGASAITISTAARLGMKTGFVGIVGNDLFGRSVTNRMSSDGVNLDYLETIDGLQTGIAFVMYRSDGGREFNYILDYSRVSLATPRLDVDSLPRTKWIHIHGTMLGEKSIWRKYGFDAIEKVLADGGRLSFDSNFRPELMDMKRCRADFIPIIQRATYFMPSEEEILALFDTADLTSAMKQALDLGPEIVCVKRAEKGCVVVSKSEGPHPIPPFVVDSIDPTGAGDSFDAAFIWARERGLDISRSARFANAVGAFAVTRRGPMEGSPFPHELIEMFDPEDADLKIVLKSSTNPCRSRQSEHIGNSKVVP
mgnify:CR=1 FL=1|jgi:sugar/nucleoside kinase (ribokinase family)